MRKTLVDKCGFPADKVLSIPTGVDPDFFNVPGNKEAGRKYGLDIKSPVITNVGILRSVKGHEVTLKAVKTVVGSIPDARFLIVGDGPRKAELEKMVHEMGIAEYITFTGFVRDITEIYSFTDVAVLSSWSEGLPQSLLQAMAAGVPVAATNVGGIPEVVVNDKTGMLVEPGDHEALGKAIVRILKNPDCSRRLAKEAQESVRQHHSMNHMIDETEKLYMDLMQKRNG